MFRSSSTVGDCRWKLRKFYDDFQFSSNVVVCLHFTLLSSVLLVAVVSVVDVVF